MKTILFVSIGLIALVLWIDDWWEALAGSPETPTDCSEEDVPIIETERPVTNIE